MNLYNKMVGYGMGFYSEGEKFQFYRQIQQGTNIPERLLNKPYVNDVTLRGQKSPLKCC